MVGCAGWLGGVVRGEARSATRTPTALVLPAVRQEYARELKKALDETRQWTEHLIDELETSQALVLSMRRELNEAKAKVAEGS